MPQDWYQPLDFPYGAIVHPFIKSTQAIGSVYDNVIFPHRKHLVVGMPHSLQIYELSSHRNLSLVASIDLPYETPLIAIFSSPSPIENTPSWIILAFASATVRVLNLNPLALPDEASLQQIQHIIPNFLISFVADPTPSKPDDRIKSPDSQDQHPLATMDPSGKLLAISVKYHEIHIYEFDFSKPLPQSIPSQFFITASCILHHTIPHIQAFIFLPNAASSQLAVLSCPTYESTAVDILSISRRPKPKDESNLLSSNITNSYGIPIPFQHQIFPNNGELGGFFVTSPHNVMFFRSPPDDPALLNALKSATDNQTKSGSSQNALSTQEEKPPRSNRRKNNERRGNKSIPNFSFFPLSDNNPNRPLGNLLLFAANKNVAFQKPIISHTSIDKTRTLMCDMEGRLYMLIAPNQIPQADLNHPIDFKMDALYLDKISPSCALTCLEPGLFFAASKIDDSMLFSISSKSPNKKRKTVSKDSRKSPPKPLVTVWQRLENTGAVVSVAANPNFPRYMSHNYDEDGKPPTHDMFFAAMGKSGSSRIKKFSPGLFTKTIAPPDKIHLDSIFGFGNTYKLFPLNNNGDVLVSSATKSALFLVSDLPLLNPQLISDEPTLALGIYHDGIGSCLHSQIIQITNRRVRLAGFPQGDISFEHEFESEALLAAVDTSCKDGWFATFTGDQNVNLFQIPSDMSLIKQKYSAQSFMSYSCSFLQIYGKWVFYANNFLQQTCYPVSFFTLTKNSHLEIKKVDNKRKFSEYRHSINHPQESLESPHTPPKQNLTEVDDPLDFSPNSSYIWSVCFCMAELPYQDQDEPTKIPMIIESDIYGTVSAAIVDLEDAENSDLAIKYLDTFHIKLGDGPVSLIPQPDGNGLPFAKHGDDFFMLLFMPVAPEKPSDLYANLYAKLSSKDSDDMSLSSSQESSNDTDSESDSDSLDGSLKYKPTNDVLESDSDEPEKNFFKLAYVPLHLDVELDLMSAPTTGPTLDKKNRPKLFPTKTVDLNPTVPLEYPLLRSNIVTTDWQVPAITMDNELVFISKDSDRWVGLKVSESRPTKTGVVSHIKISPCTRYLVALITNRLDQGVDGRFAVEPRVELVVYYIPTMKEVERMTIGLGISTALDVFYVDILAHISGKVDNYDHRALDYFSIFAAYAAPSRPPVDSAFGATFYFYKNKLIPGQILELPRGAINSAKFMDGNLVLAHEGLLRRFPVNLITVSELLASGDPIAMLGNELTYKGLIESTPSVVVDMDTQGSLDFMVSFSQWTLAVGDLVTGPLLTYQATLQDPTDRTTMERYVPAPNYFYPSAYEEERKNGKFFDMSRYIGPLTCINVLSQNEIVYGTSNSLINIVHMEDSKNQSYPNQRTLGVDKESVIDHDIYKTNYTIPTEAPPTAMTRCTWGPAYYQKLLNYNMPCGFPGPHVSYDEDFVQPESTSLMGTMDGSLMLLYHEPNPQKMLYVSMFCRAILEKSSDDPPIYQKFNFLSNGQTIEEFLSQSTSDRQECYLERTMLEISRSFLFEILARKRKIPKILAHEKKQILAIGPMEYMVDPEFVAKHEKLIRYLSIVLFKVLANELKRRANIRDVIMFIESLGCTIAER